MFLYLITQEENKFQPNKNSTHAKENRLYTTSDLPNSNSFPFIPGRPRVHLDSNRDWTRVAHLSKTLEKNINISCSSLGPIIKG